MVLGKLRLKMVGFGSRICGQCRGVIKIQGVMKSGILMCSGLFVVVGACGGKCFLLSTFQLLT